MMRKSAQKPPRKPLPRHRHIALETLEPRHLLAGLNVGGITHGAISTFGERDSYTFTGGNGNVIDIILTSTPITQGFSTFARLLAPNGDVHDAFGVGNGNRRITLPSQQGTYTLQISDFGDDARGKYTIGMERLNPISPNPATLRKGEITAGVINNPIEKDQFTFQATAHARFDLILTSEPTSGGFSTYAELFAPSGTRVDAFGVGNGNRRIQVGQESGTYMLMVYDVDLNATGKYTIGFEGINPISPNPRPLNFGGIIAGGTSRAIEKDQFIIPAQGLERIDLIVTSTPKQGNFSTFVELFAPSGVRVDAFGVGNGNRRIDLPDESGNYMLMIYDANLNATGNYTIGYEGLSPFSPGAVPLNVGGITTGATRGIEKDQLQFTAAASSSVDLYMTSVAAFGNYSAFAELFAPSGERVDAWGVGNGNRRVQLPDQQGTYTIMVYDSALTAGGQYKIGIEGLNPISPNPRTLVRNATTTGEVSRAMEKDQFIFRALNNETIQLRLSSIAIDAGFNAYAELFAPSGNRIDAFTAANGLRTIKLNNTGTGDYMLMVYATNLNSRGQYGVAFNGNPLPAVINAPTSLRMTASYDNRINLAWTQNSNNEQGFQIAVSFDSGESFITVGTTTINGTTFTVPNLIPGQKYQVKVRAFNDNNVSLYSNTIEVSTKLVAPTNLRAVNLTASSLRLRWNDNSNNETRFDIYQKIGDGAFVRIGTAPANATVFNVGNLSAGTAYRYRVRAWKPGSVSNVSNTLLVNTPSARALAWDLLAEDSKKDPWEDSSL